MSETRIFWSIVHQNKVKLNKATSCIEDVLYKNS